MKYSISIVGAGRVGRALALSLFNAGFRIDKIISKSSESAKSLAELTKSDWSTDIQEEISSDLVVLAVPDGLLNDLIPKLGSNENSIFVHTAASHGLEIFGSLSCRGSGVFYPLQTFTIGRDIDLQQIPILIEGSDDHTEKVLKSIAESLSNSVYFIGEEERKLIHLAAVFVCNFVNQLYLVGEEITKKTNLPESVLEPLIEETLKKARDIGPRLAQTGPASRNDIVTIEKHRELLSYSPEFRDIYDSITNSIIKNRAR